MTAVQIPLSGLPFDPAELPKLPIAERAEVYTEVGLCRLQRAAAEEAVRLVLAGSYRRPS